MRRPALFPQRCHVYPIRGSGGLLKVQFDALARFRLWPRAVAHASRRQSDLEEDQKQHILVAVSCPCCGAGATSFTASCGVDLTPSFTGIR
jgi:hypothetical protein